MPIDWAEIAQALRTVWLRSLRKPETAKAIVDLNTGALALGAPGLARSRAALAGHGRHGADKGAGVRFGR